MANASDKDKPHRHISDARDAVERVVRAAKRARSGVRDPEVRDVLDRIVEGQKGVKRILVQAEARERGLR